MKVINLNTLVAFLFVFIAGRFNLFAQKEKVGNLPHFDEKLYHFGFLLSYNSADFQMNMRTDYPFSPDSILGLSVKRRPGFNLGIISSLNLSKNISLRFLPELSFQDRDLYFSEIKNNKVKQELIGVRSVFLNFPLNLKLRTDRVNNFAAYVIGGYNFGIDMQNQKDVDANDIVKIKRLDHQYQIGGGFDFFLLYFKFGIELKLYNGIKNALIQEYKKYSSPIEILKTRVWVVTLTFEG